MPGCVPGLHCFLVCAHRSLRLPFWATGNLCRLLPSAQVLETLKDPIQTLVLGREAEVVYAVLSNFLVLAQRYPVMFSQVCVRCLSLVPSRCPTMIAERPPEDLL